MDIGEKKPKVRTTEPFRAQGVMRFEFAEDLIGPEHPARALWDVLGTLDLAPFTAAAKALEGHAGRPVHTTRMLLSGVILVPGGSRCIQYVSQTFSRT